MKLVSGKPFWPSINRPAPRYPTLHRDTTCEIAVIGGGYSGALIGHTLTAAGADVLLVDRRDFGMGSTAASTALIEYQLDAKLHQYIKLAGVRAAVRSYRLSRDAIDILERIIMGLDDACGWERKKGLLLASSPKALRTIRTEYRTRVRHRFRVDILTKQELAEPYGVRAPGALLYHDAAQVDPYCLTHTLMRCAAPWAGAFAATKDGLGYVDETPLFPHAYFALGVGGNGMIFSVIAAGIIRDLYTGKKNRDRALFRFDRPGAALSGR